MPLAKNFLQAGRGAMLVIEIALLSTLILATRCANFYDVFVGGKIYFVDADCYSRMTRARLVTEHPGLIVRQQDFENFPAGVTPHTTAPLDYLISGLTKSLAPFTAQPLDHAGALISPLLALIGGWFLWWWSRRIHLPYRWTALLIYALSPILAHGTALGRPDHQSLLIVLLLVALAAEWSLQQEPSPGWSVTSGLSWGFALWVSLYEPLLLLVVLLGTQIIFRQRIFAGPRRIGWLVLAGVILLAITIERRWPALPDASLRPFFARWSSTIGELSSVSLTNPIWRQWFGFCALAAPVLALVALRRKLLPPFVIVLLAATFLLTIWQARWGYFLGVIFCLTIPQLCAVVRQKWLGYLLFGLALWPCLQFWDTDFWPNEKQSTMRNETRVEAISWRALASSLGADGSGSFLAPWWLSPEVAYWSGQPGVAGSSHEGLAGIVDSARFFLATAPNDAEKILRRHDVRWVLAYDGERTAQNCATILGVGIPQNALCLTLDHTPSRAPNFLQLVAQTDRGKLYRVRD